MRADAASSRGSQPPIRSATGRSTGSKPKRRLRSPCRIAQHVSISVRSSARRVSSRWKNRQCRSVHSIMGATEKRYRLSLIGVLAADIRRDKAWGGCSYNWRPAAGFQARSHVATGAAAPQDAAELREEIMPGPKPPAFETLSLHAGQHPDPVTGARAVPIYQTTSYVFQDSDHAAALFNLERAGHIYTRISNPTTAVLEERLAALEGGVGAICTASGMAAMHLAIATLLGAGDHIVASSSLYGGTINLLTHTLPRFGIATTFVKPRALDEFRAAIKPNTRLVIGETIGNPGLEVLDIPNIAQIAHDAKIPLLIDNTFATPYLSRPIELGADIVMNSTTKWIGGHGIAIGGVIVDGGRFDWRASGKFLGLTEPYAGYHGIVFDEQFGQAAFIMRARTEGLRDFGACLSPTNAFQLLQGVETLGVRMDRHVANTQAVLAFLAANKAVDWVLHPSLG